MGRLIILLVLRTYVAEHSRDWYLYMCVLVDVHNCEPHTPTIVTPFKLLFNKPFRSIGSESKAIDWKAEGKLQTKIETKVPKHHEEDQRNLTKRHTLYKKKYDEL